MTIELNETGLAELDFATPEVDVHAELIERHRELAKIMVSPGKALAIPVAEPLEQKLLREYKELLHQQELRRHRHRIEMLQWQNAMLFPRHIYSSCCSPSRYNMLIDHERTVTFPRSAPQVPAFFSDVLLPAAIAFALSATIVALVFVIGFLVA